MTEINIINNLKLMEHIKSLDNNTQNSTDHSILWSEWTALHHYLSSFSIGEGNCDVQEILRYVNDALPRFLHTLDLLPHQSGLKVLELGANPYLFTLLMKKMYNYDLHLANFFGKDIFSAQVGKGTQRVKSCLYEEEYGFEYDDFNIELSDYPYTDDCFDIVLFCEILEHIVVDPLAVFGKLRRILKPGGSLIITTPNAVRLSNVAYMFHGSNFFDRYHINNGIYGRHNREFTVGELENILARNGYQISQMVTYDRYDYDAIPITTDNYEKQIVLPYNRTDIFKKLKSIGASLENRGDNIYVVAKKTEVVHNL